MTEIQVWHWSAFSVFVAVALILDLAVFHRHSHEPTLRESAFWTVVWCTLAAVFNLIIWWWMGGKPALEFLTGYLVEWSLSMDNVFVFAVIFRFFAVPLKYQYRVLFWGILGAVAMRLIFILAGAALIHRFEWIIWVFGVFLIYTGIKLALEHDQDPDPERSLVLRLARRIFPVAHEDHGKRFFARESGKWCVTPLFFVLLFVETTDVLFAVDSVPAIFGVVDQKASYFQFIVFTSNVFAILGLRALYFLLAGVMDLFHYLSYGLSAVLVFVGGKMVAEAYWKEDFQFFKQYPWASLLVIVGLLGTSIAASLVFPHRGKETH